MSDRAAEKRVYVCHWQYVPHAVPIKGTVTVEARSVVDAVNLAKEAAEVFPQLPQGYYASDVEILSVEIKRGK